MVRNWKAISTFKGCIVRRWDRRPQVRVQWLVVSALTCSCWIAGCATAPPSASRTSDNLSAAVMFLDADGSVVPIDGRPSEARLTLGVIAGGIGGSPQKTIQAFSISNAQYISLDIRDISITLGSAASTMTQAEARSGFQVTPAETRLARVSTQTSAKTKGALIAGFRDLTTNHGLYLVYFDRPCRLLKEAQERPGRFDGSFSFDVDATESGLQWLEAVPTGVGHFVVRRPSRQPVPVVVTAPIENMQYGTFRFKHMAGTSGQ